MADRNIYSLDILNSNQYKKHNNNKQDNKTNTQ